MAMRLFGRLQPPRSRKHIAAVTNTRWVTQLHPWGLGLSFDSRRHWLLDHPRARTRSLSPATQMPPEHFSQALLSRHIHMHLPLCNCVDVKVWRLSLMCCVLLTLNAAFGKQLEYRSNGLHLSKKRPLLIKLLLDLDLD